jgi:hypothetical protein
MSNSYFSLVTQLRHKLLDVLHRIRWNGTWKVMSDFYFQVLSQNSSWEMRETAKNVAIKPGYLVSNWVQFQIQIYSVAA